MHVNRQLWLAILVLPLVGFWGCGPREKAAAPQSVQSTVDEGPMRLSVDFKPLAPRLSQRASLIVTTDCEPGVTVEWPEFGEQFGDFRVIDSQQDMPRVENDREIQRWVYTLEPMRAGRAAIWPVDVAYVDARANGDGKRHLIASKPLAVEVSTAVKADTPSLDGLQPEESPVALPFSHLQQFLGLAAILVIIAIIVYWIHRHRNKQREIAARPLTPAEIAYREIQRIIDEALADRDVKLFYVELTGVVRRFIERTTSIRAPEQTTEEFLHEISIRRTFPENENRRLKSFLEAADLVKFAAHHPRQEDVDASLARAREFVDTRSQALAAVESGMAHNDSIDNEAKEAAQC